VVLVGKLTYYIGIVLLMMGLMFAVPGIASLILLEPFWIHYFLAAAALTGLGIYLYRRGSWETLQLSEAAVVALASFLIPALVNAGIMISAGLDPWDSLFESVSGITTTGLTMYGGELPLTFVFARALLQWVGGLGIVVITLSFLIRPGTASHRLFSIHIKKDMDMPSVRSIATGISVIYGVFTALFFATYLILGTSPYSSLIHALTTVSTGGFSTSEGLTPTANAAAIVFMFLSAQSFTLYYRAWRMRRFREILFNSQTISFIILLILSGVLAYLSVLGWGKSLGGFDIVFQVVSAATTTGYSTVSMDSLNDGFKVVLVFLMLAGASIGSTGGGFKQLRLIVALKALGRNVKNYLMPEGAVNVIKVRGIALHEEEVSSHILLILLYAATLIISLTVMAVSGYGLSDSLFLSASALGTVGLQTSALAPSMVWWVKLTLILDMILGRLEVLTVLIAVGKLLGRK